MAPAGASSSTLGRWRFWGTGRTVHRVDLPVIWLNEQNLSGAHLPALLHTLPFPVHIHGSSRDLDDPTLAFCDSRALEPADVAAAEYTQWLLAHGQVTGAQVLIPRRELRTGAAAANDLAAAGVTALVPPSPAVEIADDKAMFAAVATQHAVPVPATYAVTSSADLEHARDALEHAGLQACVKPARGIGGLGFARVGQPTVETSWAELRSTGAAVPELTWEQLRNLVAGSAADLADVPLLVCEYLPGAMTSVDCWAHNGRLRSVAARRKDGHYQRPDTATSLRPHIDGLVAALGLDHVFNVQFKEDAAGQPKVLEVNPRPSGGVQIAAAMGCNLLGAAVAQALGKPYELGEARANVLMLRSPVALP